MQPNTLIPAGRPILVAFLVAAATGASLALVARATGAQDRPAAMAMLHSPIVAVHTGAGDVVTATLSDASSAVAIGESTADARGDALLQLRRDGAAAPVLPGDHLDVFSEGARLAAADAPDLAIALDAARHALIGRAPPQTSVAIEARAPDGGRIASGIVRTGSDGRFRSSLPADIQALAGTIATATWPVEGPIVFRARWDAPDGHIVLGESRVRVTAALGQLPAVFVARGGSVIAAVTGSLAIGPPPSISDLVVVGPGGQPEPILPGDTVELRQGGQVVAIGRAPNISARVEPLLDRISGRIDQPGALEIVAGSARRTLLVEPAGAFEVSFAGEVDLGPNTPAWVRTTRSPSFASPAVAEALTITLGSERVEGRAPPGWVVAATLRAEAPGGGPIGSGTTTAGQDGSFRMRLAGGDDRAAPAAPRQRLIVAWEAAPSIEVSLPEITADVDAETGLVRGQALPSAMVRVEARRGAAHGVATVRADARGAYTASIGIELGPGTSGRVVVQWDERLVIARPWAIARIAVDAAEGHVAGAGAPGQDVRARVVRKGVVVGEAGDAVGAALTPWAAELPCAPCDWSLTLSDGAFDVPFAHGDVLRVSMDGALEEAEVPGLEVEVNPYTDIVSGRAVPGWPVILRFSRDGATSADIVVRADPFGAFRARIGDSWDAGGGDLVRLAVELGPFTFVADDTVDVIDVDLDRGSIDGLALPGALVSAGVYPGTAAPRGTGSAVAAADGRYNLIARDDRGAFVVPRAGETVVVQFGTNVVAFELPELAFTLAGSADPSWITGERVAGTASPGGTVLVHATRPSGDRGARALRVAARADDGGWSLDLARRLDVAAGTRVQAIWATPDGRRAHRAVRLPLLSAQVGGTRLSGFAAPGAHVALSVTGPARTPASLEASADAEGVFGVDIAGGFAEVLTEGALVAATWQRGEGPLGEGEATMAVAGVSITLQASGRQVLGRGPAGADLALRAFGPGVVAGLPLIAARVGPTGAVTATLPGDGPLPAGAAVEAIHSDAIGHRTVALTRLPRYTLVMSESGVAGEVAPFAAVSATLALSGTAIAAHAARADTTGSVVLDLRPAAIAPAHAFRAVAGGAVVAFDVPILSAAIDRPGRRVHGAAAAGSTVSLRLEALGAPPWLHLVAAGDDATWSLDEALMPDGMSVERLRLLEARVEVGGGHIVMARVTPPAATPGSTSTASATPPPSASPDPGQTATPSRTPSPLPIAARVHLPRVMGARP